MSQPKSRHGWKIPIIRRPAPPGSAPGTLTVDPTAPAPRVTVIGFGPHDHEETALDAPDQIAGHRGRWPVLWVNVDGLGDHDVLQQIGAEFGLHHLALEDVTNLHQRAKVEPYDDHLFIVVRMISIDERIATEQVSIFVGDDFVLTFQERVGDSFEPVRRRIRRKQALIRKSGPDFLAYALIDALVDGYYPVLEQYGDRTEGLEEEVLAHADGNLGERIHAVKRDLLIVRRAIAPHREMLHTLQREDVPFITDETRIHLRDCYDHVIQLLELVETYRELSTGLLDVHLTTISNRMNEIMKVLTIFAAIFIPLGFIAGLYGMNFDPASRWNMPELRWAFGYPAVLTVMATVAVSLLFFFRRRGWIGPQPRVGRQLTERRESRADDR